MSTLVFSVHNPFPTHFGAQRRILEGLVALRELGIPVHLTGWARVSENPWTDATTAAMKREGLCENVSVFQDGAGSFLRMLPKRVVRRVRPWIGLYDPAAHARPPDVDRTTLGLRRWFQRLVEYECAEDVMIHYIYFGGIAQHAGSTSRPRTILESHDLVTLNAAMQNKLVPFMGAGPVFSPSAVPDDALDLDFYRSQDVVVHPSEFESIDQFDITLAIADDEASAMRERAKATRVFTLPTPVTVREPLAELGPLALFPIGPNPFNLQGYAWFVRKVLPRILAECPGFELGISGTIYRKQTLEAHPCVRSLGFIPAPANLWALGRMFVNPVFGGTGQQIKTLEAMAAGLPPVILRHFAHTAPVIHGVNAFVAADEAEFASYCAELWKSPELCRKMGRAAREAVRIHCSREKFAGQLFEALRDR